MLARNSHPVGAALFPGFYTSFEDAPGLDCPHCARAADGTGGCGQNACASTALVDMEASCLTGSCLVPNAAGVRLQGNADREASTGYTTQFTSTGNELGFQTYWSPCASSADWGMPSCPTSWSQDHSDAIGVIDQPSTSGTSAWGSRGDAGQFSNLPPHADGTPALYPHGSKVYMIDDADGFAYVTLDPVDVSQMANPVASIWTHIDSTGYEDQDGIRVWVTCTDGSTIDLVAGTLDDASHPVGASGAQMVENMWVAHVVSLGNTCGIATLSFGCQSNSNSEECWFDLAQFYSL